MIEKLMDSPLFSDMTISDIQHISDFCSMREFIDGDVIINENATHTYNLFLLLEGRVEIVSTINELASNEIVISSEEKDILGEISWINQSKRTASVRSVGESQVIEIDGQQLIQYLDDHHDAGYLFMKKIAQLLSRRLVSTDDLLKQVLWNI